MAYLECAKRDIAASKLLYKKKDYPNSIYHLQRATEKIVRGYFNLQTLLNLPEIRQVGHKTPTAFLQLLKRNRLKEHLLKLKLLSHGVDFNPLDNIIFTKNNLNSNSTRLELAKLNRESIEKLILVIDSISPANGKFSFESILEQKRITWDKAEAQIRQLFKSLNLPVERLDSKTLKMMVNQFESEFRIPLYVFVSLYALAVITFPHEEFTRYPDREIEPSHYTENLVVVSEFDALIGRVEGLYKYIESELTRGSSRCANSNIILLRRIATFFKHGQSGKSVY
jgi:hypothetical protein